MIHPYYLFSLNLLAVIFALVMMRVLYYRSVFFLQVFQQVGYKTNEFRGWIKEHWDEKVMPRGVLYFLSFSMLLIFVTDYMNWKLSLSAEAIILLAWGFWFLGSTKIYRPKKVKKPLVWTARVKRLSIPFGLMNLLFPLFSLFLTFGPWIYSGIGHPRLQASRSIHYDAPSLALGMALAYLFIPLFLLVAGYLMKPVETSIQNGYKRQARKKLASLPHLKIIAITGSYGKTSIKFMVRDILKERFSVCVTPGSFNTPMGICKVINNDLQAHHQILVLEMGARYAGNIAELCDIAEPDISIVSNVGVAHLETFGTQDVIAKEKGTIVDRLKKGGLAVLNGNDEKVRIMGESRQDIQRILVGTKSEQTSDDTTLSMMVSDISYSTSGTSFTLHKGEDSWPITCPLLGVHNVQNLLLALAVGDFFGLRMNTLSLAASDIAPIKHRLELKAIGDYFVIDDAFNSNPVGAQNAVEILGSFQTGKRYIITPGMIELGEKEEDENSAFGGHIAKANLDFAFIVGLERGKIIEQGYLEAGGDPKKITRVESLFEANERVQKLLSPGDVLLYENDLPDIYS